MSQMLSIGRLARQAGVNVQTVRYYERRNILSASRRKKPDFTMDHPGYRLYTEDAVNKIRFIKNAQALGFTLREISGLLRLRVSHKARCGDVKKKAESKLHDVREKMRGLKAIENVLIELIQACRIKVKTDQCPILKSLEIQKMREVAR